MEHLYVGSNVPVVTFRTADAFRKLLNCKLLSLKSSNSSYSPRQIFNAVGSLHPSFRISPTNSSQDMPNLSANSCTLLFT